MKLSIVVPAYNEEAYLGRCLEALAVEIARTSYDIEVIVVNNASTDQTGAVARTFPFVRVVDEPQKGLSQARQAGYQVSSGDLMANVDADTIMPAGWIDHVMQEFSTHPTLVALSGPYIYYDLPALTNWFIRFFYGLGKAVSTVDSLLTGRSGTMLQGGNFVLRKSALKKAGGFDVSFAFYGEDTAMAKRMGTQGEVKFSFQLPMYTSGRRLREEGVLKMAWVYGINFLWPLLFNKAYTKSSKAIRT